MIVTCLNCNKQFNKWPAQIKKFPNNYCSCSCAASCNNKGMQRHKPKIKTCLLCGKNYTNNKNHRSKLHCENCKIVNHYKLKTIGEYRNKDTYKNMHPSWIHTHIRNFNKTWNKNLRKLPCQVCGYTNHVELAHIKGVAQFNDDALLSVVNSPDNILVLCPNHHWEFDNNLITLCDIPARI